MIDPDRITFRRGNDRRFLNIDVDHEETGYVKLGQGGEVVKSWVDDAHYGQVVHLTVRCVSAPAASPTD